MKKRCRYFWDPDGENIQMAISVTEVSLRVSHRLFATRGGAKRDACAWGHAGLGRRLGHADPVALRASTAASGPRAAGRAAVGSSQRTNLRDDAHETAAGAWQHLTLVEKTATDLIDVKSKSAKWELPKPGSRFCGDWEKRYKDTRPRPAPMPICWRPTTAANLADR